MSTTIFHRRRAERFAQLLDEANGGRRHHVRSAVDEDLAELVAVGHRVSALQRSVDVQVDPEFRVGLRAMLVAAAERETMNTAGLDGQATIDLQAFRAAAQAANRPARNARRLRTRGAIIAGVACGAIAVSGISAASENAVPGDALYGMKRSTERAQLALASSDLTKGQLFLDFASTRLEEARAVDQADRVLADMDANTKQGVRLLTTSAISRRDPAALDAIDAFLKSQRATVADLTGEWDGPELERAQASQNLLAEIGVRVDKLRTSLTCVAGVATTSDDLGPKPFSCAPEGGSTDKTTDSKPADTPAQNPGNVRPEKSDPARQPAAGTDSEPTSGPAATTSDAPDSSQPADPAATTDEGGLVDDIGELLGGLLG